jgi:gamma-glutamyltranspeptidase/glutathione hydrolase
MTMFKVRFIVALLLACLSMPAGAAERQFAGAVSSATSEATAAGVHILEQGGNAIDAAIAVSLALGVSEPAGSGIGGQTVMLVKRPGEDAFVIQGTTWSPAAMPEPEQVAAEQLAYGHTASSVPSTLRVLGLAYRQYGSGRLRWPELVEPAIRLARDGILIGPFRSHAFRFYHEGLSRQPAAAAIFVRPDGLPWQSGQVLRQPALAATLQRLADVGAMDFYQGAIAVEIIADMAANGGWISASDLRDFPEPQIVPPLHSTYRGREIVTLPPPFGGWVALQALNVLEQFPATDLAADGDQRRLALLDALMIAQSSRATQPISDYSAYRDEVSDRIAKETAALLLQSYRFSLEQKSGAPGTSDGGETTHFSVVDSDGMAVAVTQSIDGYFGAQVAHPTLGFLYNNYMQGFQVADPDQPYYLIPREMPKSSMSASMVLQDGEPVLVLGSPGSARIISAVAQVVSHWLDVNTGVVDAVAAYRVHAVPPDKAYVEGESLSADLMAGMSQRGLRLVRPTYGVSDSQLDPYFGGVHALAREQGVWTGSADPRRDGLVGFAWRTQQ